MKAVLKKVWSSGATKTDDQLSLWKENLACRLFNF